MTAGGPHHACRVSAPGGLALAAGLLLSLTVAAQAPTAALPGSPADPGVRLAQGGGAPDRAVEAPLIRVLLWPALETMLVSQMAGQITELNASLGSAVRKGGKLVQMNCAEPQARLKMAQADLAAGQQTLQTKRKMQELQAAGDMEVQLAQAAVDKAQGQIALTQSQIAQCTVLAPFSGRVAKLYVKPHQGVNVGAPLLDLVSDGPLKLRLNLPSAMLRQVRPGVGFEVSIDETGRTYPAKVSAVNARVDAVAQTIEIEARIDGPAPDLLPGMSGSARFR